MTRAVVRLTRNTIGDLPARCRSCVFWELNPVDGDRARADGGPARAKEEWLSATLLGWGTCGWVVSVDGVSAAYVIYAPPGHLPGSASLATSPVATDAALMTTLYVGPEHRGTGLGRLLVQTVASDLLRRNIQAVEAFADRGPGQSSCLVPADFLLAVGFQTVRPHPRHPRLRLDLRSTATWREDVEGALERLLGAITRPEPRPV